MIDFTTEEEADPALVLLANVLNNSDKSVAMQSENPETLNGGRRSRNPLARRFVR